MATPTKAGAAGASMLAKGLYACVGLSGAAAVAAGAYGAHGMPSADEYSKKVWERAVLYHLVHSGAALAALKAPSTRGGALGAAAFVAGNVLFSGSLYALAITHDSSFAKVAPYGGMLFIAGWLGLGLSAAEL